AAPPGAPAPALDEAVRADVGGAQSLAAALVASGEDPHATHVAAAYVGGISTGLRQEGALRADVDWRAEYEAALAARARVEAESSKPENLRSQLRAAKGRVGREGPHTVYTE